MTQSIKQKTAKILRRAAEIFENNGWCQDAWAKARNGRKVKVKHPGACKFCAMGGIEKASLDLKLHSFRSKANEAVIEDIPWCGLASWNDHSNRTAEEVIAQFRATADRLDPLEDK